MVPCVETLLPYQSVPKEECQSILGRRSEQIQKGSGMVLMPLGPKVLVRMQRHYQRQMLLVEEERVRLRAQLGPKRFQQPLRTTRRNTEVQQRR